ncbi:hypothetical protein GGS23DRAFT_143294 [Durotheca rogersii]|uniref:uncharacterized protein n=1 Tax=Durotheca rogersii TaxID=419775 RepID=UPI00221FCE6F|nr:uncharacterized protein GGS23DRAFT_143294 [Durotheca rogersii]KAI5861639.1 hypothetical protein GGS23DRAFT_143294 [Durotheca rogersii]
MRFSREMVEFSQDPNESLSAYYVKAQDVLRRMGARDNAQNLRPDGADDLSMLEAYLLDQTVSRFVKGLRDPDLRQEALDKAAHGARSLWEAYNIIQTCKKIVDDKREVSQQEWLKGRHDLIERYVYEKTGLPAEEAIAKEHPDWVLAPKPTGTAPIVPNSTSAQPVSQPPPECRLCNKVLLRWYVCTSAGYTTVVERTFSYERSWSTVWGQAVPCGTGARGRAPCRSRLLNEG